MQDPGRSRARASISMLFRNPAGALLLCLALITVPIGATPVAAQAGPSHRTTANAPLPVVAARADPVNSVVHSAVVTVTAYWSQKFTANGLKFVPVRRVYGYIPGDGTGCGTQANVPNNAGYCRLQDDIGYDLAWFSQQSVNIGDAFIYLVIGHEYSHAIQVRLGITHQYNIQHELQADCFVGAYIGDAIRADVLVIQDGDVQELLASLRAVADHANMPWLDPRAHGTAAQRTDAFAAGYNNGTSICN